jgi:hypothetical protein
VEVRPGLGDVAQRRHAEHHVVRVVLGDGGATAIVLVRPGLDRAQRLERRAADELTGVAHHAAGVGEDAQALDLLGGQRRLVAAEERVPPRRA